MSLDTAGYPQADKLENVILTVEAINEGYHSDREIGIQLGLERGRSYDERQGRYHRKATELLGLTRRASENHSVVTQSGTVFLRSDQQTRREMLTERVVNLPVFRNILAMLESSGGRTSTTSIENSLRVMADTTASMAHRRQQTMTSWLNDLGITRKTGNTVILEDIPASVQSIEVPDINIPVLPRAGDLRRFEEVNRRVSLARETIIHRIDAALMERRNATHQRLTNLMSAKIRRAGAVPTYNGLIDLATHIENHDYIIEVKSSVTRMRNQIRRGISQLYEYRYLQGLPNARLVLFIERQLDREDRWMLDYVIHDRGICIVWDDRENELFTLDACEDLPFL